MSTLSCKESKKLKRLTRMNTLLIPAGSICLYANAAHAPQYLYPAWGPMMALAGPRETSTADSQPSSSDRSWRPSETYLEMNKGYSVSLFPTI